MVALVVGMGAVRHPTVAGGIIGIVVLLVILGVIISLVVAWSKAKARAESAERELATLKQAYAQLNDAYWRSQQAQPARSVETSQPPSEGPAAGPPPAWPQYPEYPGRPPTPPGPPVS